MLGFVDAGPETVVGRLIWSALHSAGSYAMCGVAGEIRTDGSFADVAGVSAMCAALVARGPDGSGAWASGPVALGHRRLAIIDLSHRGDQPMVDNELGLVVVFNGCIYNHVELRRELEAQGYRFFSSSDTEVLLKAYHHWGGDFVARLQGMFAFCIVETDSGRCILGRDRLGIKPLYIARSVGCVRFASTLPALVAAGGVDTSVDPVALHHYLTFHAVVPAERTILRGVDKLPPATVLVIEPDGRQVEKRYWKLRFGEASERSGSFDPTEWQEQVAAALRLAVRRRMVSDVPVGVLLSGGLDSSLIVGLLAEEGQKALSSFSIGFESLGGEEGDEFRYSDLIASHFGTDHHRYEVPTADVLAGVRGAVGAMSEPMVSHDVVAFYLLAAEVSKSIKVVQSGQGADEVFAGYHWYQQMAKASGNGVDAYAALFCDRDHDEITAAVTARYRLDSDASYRFITSQFLDPGADSPLDRALRLDTDVMLVEDPVKRVDNMTMAWGVEARVPFLDHELVELAAACPGELKVAEGGKGVLKAVARSIIPDEVIDRPKGYFPVPPLVHLEGSYVEMLREALLAPEARRRNLFERQEVEHLFNSPNELTKLKYNKLWELGLLEMWLQGLASP